MGLSLLRHSGDTIEIAIVHPWVFNDWLNEMNRNTRKLGLACGLGAACFAAGSVGEAQLSNLHDVSRGTMLAQTSTQPVPLAGDSALNAFQPPADVVPPTAPQLETGEPAVVSPPASANPITGVPDPTVPLDPRTVPTPDGNAMPAAPGRSVPNEGNPFPGVTDPNFPANLPATPLPGNRVIEPNDAYDPAVSPTTLPASPRANGTPVMPVPQAAPPVAKPQPGDDRIRLSDVVKNPVRIYDARLLLLTGDFHAAEGAARTLQERFPADARIDYLKYFLFARSGQRDRAIGALNDAVRAERSTPVLDYDRFMEPLQGPDRFYLERVRRAVAELDAAEVLERTVNP